MSIKRTDFLKKYNNFDRHFIFDKKNDAIDFVNAEYVHPLKQDLIQGFQEEFQNDANVLAVIVFGSGVEFRCNSYSDLDLLFERKDCNQYFHFSDRYINELVDVLYADQIGEHLKKEIEEKGIVVYDKEKAYV